MQPQGNLRDWISDGTKHRGEQMNAQSMLFIFIRPRIWHSTVPIVWYGILDYVSTCDEPFLHDPAVVSFCNIV